MALHISDTFLMQEDGRSANDLTGANNMVVAIGEDGQFYRHKAVIKNEPESLGKAVTFAHKVAEAKAVNPQFWVVLDTQWVTTNSPFIDFH